MKLLVMANRVKMSLYEIKKNNELTLLEELENPLGKLKSKEMQYDESGMSRGKFKGAAPHKLASRTDPHEAAAIDFGKSIAKHLSIVLNKSHDAHILFSAEPKFLGIVKSHMNPKANVEWVKKDLFKIHPSKWHALLGIPPYNPPRLFESASF